MVWLKIPVSVATYAADDSPTSPDKYPVLVATCSAGNSP